MIELTNISFSYGEKSVLEDFTLRVDDGDRVCLFGESGRGKTTIARLILGLEKPQSGKVVSTGSVSVVFQEDRLLPFRTVRQNIRLFSGADDDDMDTILHRLGIYDFRDKYPAQLSGGIARRAALAAALCRSSDAYLFDEPFSGLDDANAKRAIDLINEITVGKTVILITHNRNDAQSLKCRTVTI